MVNNISITQRVTTTMLLAILIGTMPGCEGGRRPGFPKQSFDEKKLIVDLETKFRLPDKIKEYYDVKSQLQKSNDPNAFAVLTDGQRELLKTKRNEIISARLALINLNYNQFVSDASFNRQVFDLTTEMADLGVDIATTTVSGASTKTTLGAISAGISGTQTAVAKNFFFQKTMSALVGAMNARRKQALEPIIRGAMKPVDDYPLEQALSDLDVYYFSGTFLGALDYIRTTAAIQEREATNKIIEIQVNNDPEVRRLRRSIYIWLRQLGNKGRLEEEVAKQFNNAAYVDWLQTASATDLRKVMGTLTIPELSQAELDADAAKIKQKLDQFMSEREKKLDAARSYITVRTLAAVRSEIKTEFAALPAGTKPGVLVTLSVVKPNVADISAIGEMTEDKLTSTMSTIVDNMTKDELANAMVAIFDMNKNDVTHALGIRFTFIGIIQGAL